MSLWQLYVHGCHIPRDVNLHQHSCENRKSWLDYSFVCAQHKGKLTCNYLLISIDLFKNALPHQAEIWQLLKTSMLLMYNICIRLVWNILRFRIVNIWRIGPTGIIIVWLSVCAAASAWRLAMQQQILSAINQHQHSDTFTVRNNRLENVCTPFGVNLSQSC
jgi:hypothetical protein